VVYQAIEVYDNPSLAFIVGGINGLDLSQVDGFATAIGVDFRRWKVEHQARRVLHHETFGQGDGGAELQLYFGFVARCVGRDIL
jgi:hypothetical protein